MVWFSEKFIRTSEKTLKLFTVTYSGFKLRVREGVKKNAEIDVLSLKRKENAITYTITKT